jgi:hypothetical protein
MPTPAALPPQLLSPKYGHLAANTKAGSNRIRRGDPPPPAVTWTASREIARNAAVAQFGTDWRPATSLLDAAVRHGVCF